MCLTSDAVYRIRDADAIFRIERKDDQKIAQKSTLFYRKYFEYTFARFAIYGSAGDVLTST